VSTSNIKIGNIVIEDLHIVQGNDTLLPHARIKEVFGEGFDDPLIQRGIDRDLLRVVYAGQGSRRRYWLSSVLTYLRTLEAESKRE
jgi:hypothetical protein